MLSLSRTRYLSLSILTLAMSSITGCGGAPSDSENQSDVDIDEAEVSSAESALTTSLPSVFTATIQNASRNGSTNECLMFYGGAQYESPSRYLWANDNGYCGFPSKADLLANHQAVFKFTSLGDGLYTISTKAGTGTNQCLMYYVANYASPTRYLWGGGDNGFCGFPSKADLLANKQAVWKVQARGGNKFTISHTLTNQCMIFGGNGTATHPIRYNWPLGGSASNCGWDVEANMISNGQAIYTITVQEALVHPTSCAAVKAEQPTATDGEYVLAVAGGPASIYCADMASAPKEYLTLQNTGGLANYSQYSSGYVSPGSDVRTHYEKVRINPSNLTVDISDQTFSSSTGQLHHGGELVTSMPYGVAMACDYVARGVANINLRGTPFAVAPNEFGQFGSQTIGQAVYNNGNQVVELDSIGNCGWTNPHPSIYNPFNNAGGYNLNLVYSVDPGSLAPQPPVMNGQRTFRTSLTGGALSFVVAASAVSAGNTTATINGTVTVGDGGTGPGVTLANANLTLTLDPQGYITELYGTADIALPGTGGLNGLTLNNLAHVTVGLAKGATLETLGVEAPLRAERTYLVFDAAAGLSGSFGAVQFGAGPAASVKLVVDPRDPSLYFHATTSGIRGLPSVNAGFGLSAQGLLPFQHETTWGIEDFAQDFNAHVLIEAPIPIRTTLPISAEGLMMVRLPTSADPFTRIGVNGVVSADISFLQGTTTFSVPLSNATVGGKFGASTANDEVYFSADATTSSFVDALPDLAIMPSVGVKVAGRLSTNAANQYLRVAGNGTFVDHEILNLEMRYSPTGVWASGNFQIGGGFRANLSGTVNSNEADLNGEGYVEIPIFGAKQVVQGTWQTINYVHNGAVCGWTTAANGAECGWLNFADSFCQTFPWLCSAPPATCTFSNSCTASVWVEQTIQEPNWSYGAFKAKANFHAKTPWNVTVNFANNVCPAGVGACSVSVENLYWGNPKACVTTEVFGKFCHPLTIK